MGMSLWVADFDITDSRGVQATFFPESIYTENPVQHYQPWTNKSKPSVGMIFK